LITLLIGRRLTDSFIETGILVSARSLVDLAILPLESGRALAVVLAVGRVDALPAIQARLLDGAGSPVRLAIRPHETLLAVAKVGVTLFVADPPIFAGIGLAVLLLSVLARVSEISVFAIAEKRVAFLVANSVVQTGVWLAVLLLLRLAGETGEARFAVAEKRVTLLVANAIIHARVRLAMLLFALFALVAIKAIFAVAEESVTLVVANPVIEAGLAAALVR